MSLSIAGMQVGSATADGGGAFSEPLSVPDLPLGRVLVAADCGPTFTTTLELAVATSVDAGTGVLGLFFFFLLLGLMLFRRRRLISRQGDPRAPLGDEAAGPAAEGMVT